MQCLRLNTVLWISASFQLRSHAVQCSCSQLPYNFPPEIKSTTNFVTGNIAQVFNICKSPLQVDRKGQPISIKLRKEEVKRSKEQQASGDRILQKQIM